MLQPSQDASIARIADITFQTPSAGRWVLQLNVRVNKDGNKGVVSNPISGEVGAAANFEARLIVYSRARFKPHQRGGGCCSNVGRILIFK